MRKTIISLIGICLWASGASAQPQVSGPFLPSGCTADQTIAYNATTAAWECDSTISVTSLTASGTAPVVTWTDTTTNEDDFTFTADADVATFASGATNIFQAFGATHASAGKVSFPGALILGSAGVASGIIDTTESMMFSIDTDNTQVDRAFVWYKNAGGGSGTELMRLGEDGKFGVNSSAAAPRYQNTTVGVLSSLLSDDGTNYGGLTITPGAADVTFAAVTAGTFGDNVDLMFTPAGTGDMWLTLGDLNIDTDAGVLNFGASQDNAIGRADGSSIYVSKGLHVGGTGAVADNNLVVDGTLVVSGAGPHAIGGASETGTQLYITGSWNPSAVDDTHIGIYINSTIAGYAARNIYGVVLAPTLVEAASGVHARLAGLNINAPVVSGDTATVTDAVTVYIAGAPSATVSGANYALWVDAGTVRLDGDLGTSTATVPNVYASAYHVGAAAGIDATCVAAVATITVSKGIVTAITCP